MKSAQKVLNWINGTKVKPVSNKWLDKFNPHNGSLLCKVADSTAEDVDNAVDTAYINFPFWANLTPINRGQILDKIVVAMKHNEDELAKCVALETGKPPQDAKSEVVVAILQAQYWAGESMRLYGRTLTSGMLGKHSYTIRQPHGVAGLIIPANTSLANITWKVFPALICGNTVVLKASEDAPFIANLFAQLTQDAGLPDGVFNVIHGCGRSAGGALVNHHKVPVISFTGSTEVGRWIAEVAGRRLARISLELGGKNPLVVCDDADIDQAVHWASLSAFSNAGQRCSAGSRIIVFEGIYNKFRNKLIAKANSLKLGTDVGCDLGPVINHYQQQNILKAIKSAKKDNGVILCGGDTPNNPELLRGFYVLPTLIERLKPSAELNQKEVFGPVATLNSVSNIQEALKTVNDCEYGLTAAVHTKNIDRAMWFAQRIRTGVVNINLGTYGSEPHMPFGGLGASGNGTREPGVEALNVYSEIKNISFLVRNDLI